MSNIMLDDDGMKLAEYLLENDISTADFAATIGVTSEAVRLYVLGKRMPRPEHMMAIINATDGAVTAADLLATASSAA